MKKILMWVAMAALVVACQPSANKGPVAEGEAVFVTDSGIVEDIYEIYQGVIPGANGVGIDYVLTLNAEIMGNDTLFTLEMTYLDKNGASKGRASNSKGKQEKIHKVVNKQPKKGVKLTPDNGSSPIYFVVVNDTTLRLVNDSLQESVTQANYDVVRVN